MIRKIVWTRAASWGISAAESECWTGSEFWSGVWNTNRAWPSSWSFHICWAWVWNGKRRIDDPRSESWKNNI